MKQFHENQSLRGQLLVIPEPLFNTPTAGTLNKDSFLFTNSDFPRYCPPFYGLGSTVISRNIYRISTIPPLCFEVPNRIVDMTSSQLLVG